MDKTHLACPGSGPADRSRAADVRLREEPDEDEEEEDGEEHDGDEEDDDRAY